MSPQAGMWLMKLNLLIDGVPGPKTCDVLKARGFANGLYDWTTAL